MLTRRELAALTLATAAAPLTGCMGLERKDPDALVWDDLVPVADVTDAWRSYPLEIAEGIDPYLVFARRDGDQIKALGSRCTHLGCPVRYVEAVERFICPCHGGVFDARGRPAGGPPQQPLERYETRVVDGRVQIARPRQAAGESS